ncbi:MAG: LPS export ABC transporter periplasmic protein LptC [Gammaproteobacteria bacterium]|nr:LPS export ABC transporter periplasmic protein LptC [Gammaproteobacteria bacterium]
MGRVRYILLLLSVLGVALFSRYLLQSVEPHGVLLPAEMRHSLDYFVTDFSATVFTREGKPYYKLKANHIEHFPDDDTVTMQYPELQFLRESTLPWLASAQTGTVYLDRDVLYLKGNVVLNRDTTDINQHMRLTAQDVIVNLTKRTVDTKSEVHIEAKSSSITATGMHLDLIKGTFKLDANAKGVYVPH